MNNKQDNASWIEDPNLINIPDAARLISGLRDTGYDLYTAAADIIDNSIAAKATVINVEMILLQGGQKFVYFGDNGEGMPPSGLWSAMKYGSPKRPSAKSLGKFGLGLKTASSSCCKRFSVITRADAECGLEKLVWDLDHVERENKWQMIQEKVTPEEEEKFNELCGKIGTLVIWSKCDKILGKLYEEPGGTLERNALNKRREKLYDHLAKVFHKYLDTHSYPEYPNVRINLNGQQIFPWNPFYPEKSEQVLAKSETELTIASEDGTQSIATMRAWILPHAKDMSVEENKTKAKISNRSQGFYIYREGRLIYSEGWLGIFRSDDPHWSLLRVEFCFDNDLDHAFQVDVKKSRIMFDPAIEEALKERLKGARNEADRRYRRKERETHGRTSLDHRSANQSIDKAKSRTKKPTIQVADISSGIGTLANNHGIVKIKTPIQNNISPEKLYVEEVTDITDGNLWEPALRSTGDGPFITGVRLNKHHDFYPKIYLKAASSGYAVEGIDLLLWALATAEYNNNNEELKAIFEDIREEISTNLRKLLADVPMPDAIELEEVDGGVED